MRWLTNVRLPWPAPGAQLAAASLQRPADLWRIGLDHQHTIVFLEPLAAGSAASGEDWGGDWLSPGAVDLQINGGMGLAFPELTAADLPHLLSLLERLWQDGVEAICPTLVTCGIAPLRQALAVLEQARQQHRPGRSLLLGAHLEGPFLAPERRGAHPAEHLAPPDLASLQERISGHEEGIDLVTLAPELPGAEAVIEALRQQGVVVSLGHSAADLDQARTAFDQGVTMLTHSFNAMNGLHHRQPGPVAAAVLDGRVALGLIADGVHVDPAMAVLLQRLAPERLVLVSDALAPYGLPDGQHRWDERTLLVEQGICRLEDGTLAGVTLPLLETVSRLAAWGGEPGGAIAAATVTPRRVLGDDRTLPELLQGVPLRETLRWSLGADGLQGRRPELGGDP
jgi:N-acetylglucosamine-6-phosphate deacetylase